MAVGTRVSVTCERMWLPHCVAPRPLLARYTPQLVRLAQGPHLCGSKHNSRHCCVMSIAVYACKLVNTTRSGFFMWRLCHVCDGCSAVRWTFPPFAGEHPWTADTFFCFISSSYIGQRVFDSGLGGLSFVVHICASVDVDTCRGSHSLRPFTNALFCEP